MKTVRLRVSDLGKASRYFDKTDNGEEPNYNYRVRAPELPRAEFLEGEKGFGSSADDWMGTPQDRQDWGRGVKVAILDSGIDQAHSNLNGVAIEEIDLIGGGGSSTRRRGMTNLFFFFLVSELSALRIVVVSVKRKERGEERERERKGKKSC